ncbi:MAG: hypothetical protein Q8941_20525 [Bacteroidota bacterium]|nr:hypothetical protein [Bacteroidota bacterium]
MSDTIKWTSTDLLNFTAYLDTARHAAGSLRAYPIFGNNVPIKSITDSNEADVVETFEDGSKTLVRRGMYNRLYLTDKGGLILAQKLFAINRHLGFIEVDADNKVAMMTNSDGTFSPFPVNQVYAPLPDLANLKTTYHNKLSIDFSSEFYIKRGKILQGDSTEDILSMKGLLDSAVTVGATPSTTTHIFIGAQTNYALTDLVNLYTGTGAGKIGQIANFIVKKVSDGSVVTPSAVAITSGQVDLTGTYSSGASYTVEFAAPSVLKTNGLEGYEGTIKATIAIP